MKSAKRMNRFLDFASYLDPHTLVHEAKERNSHVLHSLAIIETCTYAGLPALVAHAINKDYLPEGFAASAVVVFALFYHFKKAR